MADISITAANVLKGTGTTTVTTGTAGANLTAGQSLYIDSSDSNKLKAADNDNTSATATCVGVALHNTGSGQPITYLTAGNITIGGTVVVGVPYYVSSTAGGICPFADLNTGDWVSRIGDGISTTVINVSIANKAVQIP